MAILRFELSDAVNLSSLRFSIFYCPAHQVPWEDRKPYIKKDTPLGVPLLQSASSYVRFFPPGYWVFVAVDGLM